MTTLLRTKMRKWIALPGEFGLTKDGQRLTGYATKVVVEADQVYSLMTPVFEAVRIWENFKGQIPSTMRHVQTTFVYRDTLLKVSQKKRWVYYIFILRNQNILERNKIIF